jgi:hypothetical protein
MVTIICEEDAFAGLIASGGTRDKNVTEPFSSSGIVSPATVGNLHAEQQLELVENWMRVWKTYTPTPSTVHHSGGWDFATTKVKGTAIPSALTASNNDTSSKLLLQVTYHSFCPLPNI